MALILRESRMENQILTKERGLLWLAEDGEDGGVFYGCSDDWGGVSEMTTLRACWGSGAARRRCSNYEWKGCLLWPRMVVVLVRLKGTVVNGAGKYLEHTTSLNQRSKTKQSAIAILTGG